MLNLAPLSTIHNGQFTPVNGIPPGYRPPPIDPKAMREAISFVFRGFFHGLLVPFSVLTGCKGDPVFLGLLKGLENSDPAVRRISAVELGKMGHKALSAVPALTKALKDDDLNVRKAAAVALGGIGQEAFSAVPALIEGLKNGDPCVYKAMVVALGDIGPRAVAAVPALINALKDGEKDAREETETLCKIGSAAVPALIETFKSNNLLSVRMRIAYVLGKIGPAASAAVSVLIWALNNSHELVRRKAAEALGKIGPKAVPALIKALKDHNFLAAIILGNIGPRASEAIPALTEALNDSNPGVRFWAADALKKIRRE